MGCYYNLSEIIEAKPRMFGVIWDNTIVWVFNMSKCVNFLIHEMCKEVLSIPLIVMRVIGSL
jgi:hypothetical protein